MSKKVVSLANHGSTLRPPSDILAWWLEEDALSYVRDLQHAIHDVLETDETVPQCETLTVSIDGYSSMLCFFYTALFAAVRGLLGKFRTSNPMWIKAPEAATERIDPTGFTVANLFTNAVEMLADLLTVPEERIQCAKSLIQTGNANSLPFDANSFDAAISSPPYATRLDYIRGTLPELAILGAREGEIQTLREVATGSPVIRHVTTDVAGPTESQVANKLLQEIESHPSKGSRSYYYPWMKSYFHSLQNGLKEINRTVKRDGVICLVVQNSRYKNLHINLQQIVVEILGACGRSLHERHDHPAPNPRFADVQLSDSKSRSATSLETLLIFG